MRMMLMMSLVFLSGCGTYQSNVPRLGPYKTSSDYGKREAPKEAPKGDEGRLERLEAQLTRIEAALSGVDQDRKALAMFNTCQRNCDARFPWPEKPENAKEDWWDRPEIKRAQKERFSCMKACDGLKPITAVDMGC